MKVTAKATRSEGWWAVEVPEVPGVFTQARRLEQVPAMTADAVALMLDITPDEVEVEVSPTLDADTREAITEARRAVKEAAERQHAAAEKSRAMVRKLRAENYSMRDIGVITGLSFQRVAKLAENSKVEAV